MKKPFIVLITGASSGIGLASGQYLSARGFYVIGTSRTPNKYPDHPFPLVAMDVTDNASIESAIHQIVSDYTRVDVLINNAGMGMAGPLEELDMEPFDRVLTQTLRVQFL